MPYDIISDSFGFVELNSGSYMITETFKSEGQKGL